MRNPDWSRDETILLMALYRSAPRAGRSHPEVRALSHLLQAAGRREGRMVAANFRNADGIAMRLRNFGRHDPVADPYRTQESSRVERSMSQFGGSSATIRLRWRRRSNASVDR